MPTSKRVLLGELLVQAKVITPEQLGEILSSPRDPGKKLGQMLLERGWVTEAQLTQTLSLQLSVPWVSLSHIDFSRQLLNRVSRELAEEHCLIPIFVRHVKGQGETLYVAMDDPTNEPALQEVSRLAGLPARPMIASASDIRSAIRLYYGEPAAAPLSIEVPMTAREGRPRAEPPPRPSGPAGPPSVPSKPAVPAPPAPPRAPAASAPALPEEAPPMTARSSMAAPVPSAPPAPAPAPPPSSPTVGEEAPPPSVDKKGDEGEPSTRRIRPRMLSLTLLDGTTIGLPAEKPAEKEAAPLSARELVATLRAAAKRTEPGDAPKARPRFEPVVAALISLLLDKGVITERELVEELRKKT